jgi:hypothetical protein
MSSNHYEVDPGFIPRSCSACDTLCAGRFPARRRCLQMKGEKVILHHPAHPNYDMSIDINNDGTLQTPYGEITKKGN